MQSLQTTGKEMFSIQRNTASEKNANLSKIQTFFHWSQRIAQNVEEKKVDAFSIAIWIVISAVQLLTKKITTGTQSNIYDGDFSFFQKIPIANVRLDCKYTSQLVFNDKFSTRTNLLKFFIIFPSNLTCFYKYVLSISRVLIV